jgi:hypothetical protein
MQEGSLRFETQHLHAPQGAEGIRNQGRNQERRIRVRAVYYVALDYEMRRQTEILEDGGR